MKQEHHGQAKLRAASAGADRASRRHPTGWQQPSLILAVAATVLTVVFALTRDDPRHTSRVAESTASVSRPAQRQPDRHAVRNFHVVLSHNAIASGGPFHVRKGDRVIMKISCDDQDGADFTIKDFSQTAGVQTGSVTEFDFIANRSGRFGIGMEQHDTDEGEATFVKQVGELVVE